MVVTKLVHERKAAEAVVGIVWKRYGNRAFRVDLRGDNARALRLAAKRGWCWWPRPDRPDVCALTRVGAEVAARHGGGAG